MRSAQRPFVFLIALILISILVLVPIEKVQAAGTLDQQQTVSTTAWIESGVAPLPNYVTQFYGQTFRCGLTGSLTEVDIVIGCAPGLSNCLSFGAVTVEIHSATPTGTLLGSSSLGASAIPNYVGPAPTAFVAFTFSIPVVAGSVYAIAITTTGAPGLNIVPPEYDVGGADSTGNAYLAGMLWSCVGNGCSWTSDAFNDLAFKTYVTTGAPVGAVGGIVTPVNTFAVLAPWLAVIGLVGCISAAVVVAKKLRA